MYFYIHLQNNYWKMNCEKCFHFHNYNNICGKHYNPTIANNIFHYFEYFIQCKFVS